MQVLRTEGEDNGEWIIVDCGAAVAHIMQPNIRDYYHLEEIWGDKPVKMKLGTEAKGLVKAAEPAPAKKTAATTAPAKKAPASKAPTGKAPPRAAAKKSDARPQAGRRAGAGRSGEEGRDPHRRA